MKGHANVHRGEAATYTCEAGVLQFPAGLGVRPAEVYIPIVSRFVEQVPPWALGLHGHVVSCFEELGVEVVLGEDFEIEICTTFDR